MKNLALLNRTANKSGLVDVFWYGEISNCYVSGEIGKELSESTYDCFGGLVAYALTSKECRISDCFNLADVYCGSSTLCEGAGGIVGYVRNNGDETNPLNISYCENYGRIYSNGLQNIGGICGRMYLKDISSFGHVVNSATNRIENCINYGELTAIAEEDIYDEYGVGGIVGEIYVERDYEYSSVEVRVYCCADYGKITEREGCEGAICGIATTTTPEDNSSAKVSFYNCLVASQEGSYGTALCDSIIYDRGIISFEYCCNWFNEGGGSGTVYHDTENTRPTSDEKGYFYMKDCYCLDESYETPESLDGLTRMNSESLRNFDPYTSGFDFEFTWDMSEEYYDGLPYIMNRDQQAEKAKKMYEMMEEEEEVYDMGEEGLQ